MKWEIGPVSALIVGLILLSGCGRTEPLSVEQAVRAWSRDESPGTSASAFAAAKRSANAVSDLQQLASDPTETVRRRAFAILVQGYDLPAFAWFPPGAADTSAEVRQIALVGMSKSRDRRAHPIFLRLLTEDPDRYVRCRCAEGLGATHEPRYGKALAAAATMDVEADVRSTAVWMLDELGDPAAIPLLMHIYAEEKCANVRATAARSLAGLKAVQAIDLLILGLNDPVAEVRAWSAHALGLLAAKTAVPGLIALQNDADALVREKLAAALGLIADERASDPLLSLLSDQSARVRSLAASSLRSFQDPPVTAALLIALNDPSSLVIHSAISSLEVRTLTLDQQRQLGQAKEHSLQHVSQ